MVPGLVTTEVQAWGEGYVLGFEEVLAEREGITAERADIGVQHEGFVIDLQHAGGVDAVGQAVVDLVDHQVAIVRTGGLRQAG
uniref:Transcriptional regulator n=1 Tax=Steinernema glaseri TaxID=37863 RepID=A0A1I7YB88_9BILA